MTPKANHQKAKQRTNKKSRVSNEKPIASEKPTRPLPCYLTLVPLEILAEILSYTCSPRDILALARCSRYFCNTLVQPSSAFIWKQARARCLPNPIPDPTPNFTEVSYASLIFDGGECEVCKEETSKPFVSYTIRLRLCKKSECQKEWRCLHSKTMTELSQSSARIHPILSWLPPIENRDFTCLPLADTSMFRLRDWDQAVDEYNKAQLKPETLAQYLQEKEVLAKRLPTILQHGLSLCVLNRGREKKMAKIEVANRTRTKEIARVNGWDEWNLTQSPAFTSVLRARTRCLETITDEDIERIRPILEPQIIEMGERARRRQEEENTRKRREAIETIYRHRKSLCSDKALPALSEFRKLPTSQLVQQSTGPLSESDLRKEPMLGMFSHDLEQWRAIAKEGLGALLGFPGWKDASKFKLHPVERLTARFRCKSCGNKEGRTEADWKSYGLDFVGACAHRCDHLSQKQKSKIVFKADNFELDHKAMNAVTQILSQLDVKVDIVDAKDSFDRRNTRVVCRSCPHPLIMSYDEMLRHCKRHDDAIFEALRGPDVGEENDRQGGYVLGLCAKLTGSSQGSSRERKVYGCRHCLLASKEDVSMSGASIPALMTVDSETGPSIEPAATHDSQTETVSTEAVEHHLDRKIVEKSKRDKTSSKQAPKAPNFTFDGLRSHVKAKHGIIWIGDEDVYITDPASTT